LTESGDTKDDLNLPTFVTVGEPTDDDKKLTEEILKLDTQLKLSIDDKNKLEQEKLEMLKQEASKIYIKISN